MGIVEQINEGIKEAIRARDTLRLDTFRMLKSKILAADARGNLSDAEVLKLFKTYYGNLEEGLEQARVAGRADMVQRLEGEMAIVRHFLPKVPSQEETSYLVSEAIRMTGARTKKEFGSVMKKILEMNSAVDAKLASELARQLLGD